MTPDQMLQEFGHLANAPGGAERLRRLILNLAVRGRLVPQNHEDESADRLLERAASDRERLVAEKKIRRSKALPAVDKGQVPHGVPVGWTWARLGSLGAIVGGGTPRAGDPENFSSDEGIPWLTPADLSGYRGRRISRGKRFLTEKGLASSSATVMPEGSVLFSSRAPIGYVAIAANPISTNQGFKSIVPLGGISGEYLYWVLVGAVPRIRQAASGTTFDEVSGAVMSQIEVPLPPAAEQHRIVKRVDELMVLCDELELNRVKAKELRKDTARSALFAIVESDRASKERAVALLDDHVRLALRPGDGAAEVVAELRDAIFDLAVRGRLVSQDPDAEPASVLLERIGEARERLVAEKKMSKQAPLPSLGEQEPVTDTLEGWETVRLGDFAHLEYGKSLPKDRRDPSGDVPVMGANGAMGWCHEALVEGPGIVVGRKGSAGAITEVEGPYWPTDVTYFIRGVADASLGFTSILLRTLRLPDRAKGIKPGLDRNEVHELVVAIPPADEQRRIVRRVEELTGLCDDLAQRLLDERTLASNLAESVVSSFVSLAA
jgi:type I restriction enzyme, S subunit